MVPRAFILEKLVSGLGEVCGDADAVEQSLGSGHPVVLDIRVRLHRASTGIGRMRELATSDVEDHSIASAWHTLQDARYAVEQAHSAIQRTVTTLERARLVQEHAVQETTRARRLMEELGEPGDS